MTPPPFRIRYERRGGVAGVRVARDVSSAGLTAADAAKAARLLHDARFHGLPARLASATRGADRFVFRVTVELQGRTHTVEADEEAVPASLRPLLDWLHGASA